MSKEEFLDKLRTSLSNDFAAAEVQSQLRFYSDYINDEISGGRTEAEVLEELGDPWIIARSLVNSQPEHMMEGGSGGYTEYSEAGYEDDYGYERRRDQQSYRDSGSGYGSYRTQENYYGDGIKGKITQYLFEHPRFMKGLVIGAGILIMMLIFSLVMGLFNLVAPILVPVLVILFVIRLFRGDRRGPGRW
ncbi:MAG: DUF1700 domain-containing protein [Dorea sp.]|nr:DUF1700 domain-containing protein [Dorea sp.]